MLWETSRGRANPANNYKFSSQEFQPEFDLNLYDFGARQYDPATCRWFMQDPLQELTPNLTPYKYGFNNPIRFFDKFGLYEDERDDIVIVDNNGKELYRSKDEGSTVDLVSHLNEKGDLAYTEFINREGTREISDDDFGELLEQIGNTSFYIELGLETVENAAASSSEIVPKYGYRDMARIEGEAADVLSKTAKISKVLGYGAAGLGALSAVGEFAYSEHNNSDYAELIGAGLIFGCNFITVCGPAISVGLEILDTYDVFDPVYNYFDKH
jgi:RHS repeat-associated protein